MVFYSRYSIMSHCPILGWKCDCLILFPLQIKAVEITLQWIFQTGDDALPGMTSCYISTTYNEPSS